MTTFGHPRCPDMFSVAHRLRCDCYVDICGKKAKKKKIIIIFLETKPKLGNPSFVLQAGLFHFVFVHFHHRVLIAKHVFLRHFVLPVTQGNNPHVGHHQRAITHVILTAFVPWSSIWFGLVCFFFLLSQSAGFLWSRCLQTFVQSDFSCRVLPWESNLPARPGHVGLSGAVSSTDQISNSRSPSRMSAFFFHKVFFLFIPASSEALTSHRIWQTCEQYLQEMQLLSQRKKKKKVNVCQLRSWKVEAKPKGVGSFFFILWGVSTLFNV